MKPHRINMTLDPQHTLVTCACGDFAFDGAVGLAQVMATLHLLEAIANAWEVVALPSERGNGESERTE